MTLWRVEAESLGRPPGELLLRVSLVGADHVLDQRMADHVDVGEGAEGDPFDRLQDFYPVRPLRERLVNIFDDAGVIAKHDQAAVWRDHCALVVCPSRNEILRLIEDRELTD